MQLEHRTWTLTTRAGVVEIEPGDTAALALGPEAVATMDCELTLQNGSEDYELNRGTLTVTGNVGTP